MLVSFYIITYNHEDMIAEAIEAAFAQTYSPLEIIISDDCSSDKTWEIIQREVGSYQGPHDVIVRRNPQNYGISAHINEIWKVCAGEWIVASAGDDVSLPNRVEKVVEEAKANLDVKLIQTWLNEVDEKGGFIEINRLGVLADGCERLFFGIAERLNGVAYAPHGAAMAYSRKIIDKFGPLPSDATFEDNVINIRAEFIGSSLVLPIALVNHRNHTGQATHISIRVSQETQQQRLQKALNSAVITTMQNLADLEVTREAMSDIQFDKLKFFFEQRLRYFNNRKNALLGTWPKRLFYLIRIILHKNNVPLLSRDLLVRSLLPNLIYHWLKVLRG